MTARSAVLSCAMTLGVCALVAAGCRATPQAPPAAQESGAVAPLTTATYVGRERCQRCHEREDALWKGSHHDLAMQEATADTVLGNFKDATFTYAGITSRFSTRGGKYIVRTDGPDGRLSDFEIAYVFGVYPLQQYLIGFPDGRYQTLSVAWDSRPRAAGGQRWFHLYQGEKVTHTDVLHWTKFSQNWNAQCATCHSTNLRKRYDRTTNRYDTTWSEIDVSCEACHGPGSEHVAWAERAEAGGQRGVAVDAAAARLTVGLAERRGVAWTMKPTTGIAERSRPPASRRAEVEVCAPCHARRSERFDGHVPGQPLLASYRPTFLTEGLYRADGQMQDEVYNYASFLQSKMYAAGVTCSDCHEPHSLKLRAEANAVCAPCHLASTFDSPSHHFHKPGTPGASCVGCHMTTETYMVVDPRHDHSFRVPRPDFTERFGVPNACTGCHTRKTEAWASAELDKRRPTPWRSRPHFVATLSAGRDGSAGAAGDLARLATDSRQPGIVRATAVDLLQGVPSTDLPGVVAGLVADPDPLVRLAAAQVLRSLPPADRARLGGRLLNDDLRAIRVEAAAALAGEAEPMLATSERRAFEQALDDLRGSEAFNGDRPESYVNLGLLYERRGEVARAQAEYEAATRYAPWFVPAYVNLADLQRRGGDEQAAEQTLRRALEVVPDEANLYYALGLSLIRQQKADEGTRLLGRAAGLEPSVPRFAFAHALALESQGQDAEAMKVLETALARWPDDRDLLEAAVSVAQKRGARDEARKYARRLLRVAPNDAGVAQLARQLGVS